MYLLDTNICIFAIKKKNTKLLNKIQKEISNNIFISSLTIAELEFGISKSNFPEKNRIALLEFLTIFEILNFDDKDAIKYGKIRYELSKKGTIIGPIDFFLAAQAVSKDLIFITNNSKEFKRVPDLRIEDWSI